ncbi:MAG: CDP-glucose 4,6-dehydratase [Deltaproteobacteria bacterium]|nr:CDP-glucose 4,6-dehydratase [Deltaproteobacteria bacterium]
MIDKKFWNNKKVFITGHTGFKGVWISLWLDLLGAKVTGYALGPPTEPNLFDLCNLQKYIYSVNGNILDHKSLTDALLEAKPEIVIHMAAQAIVQESYENPVATYYVNVLGTVNLLEAVRSCKSVKTVINVTTDKCYENKERECGYKENDPLGGFDPYSGSKACSEIVTSSYRDSFFNPKEYDRHGVSTATVRSGNVIGGGDWARDRLIPDCIRSLSRREKIIIRNPDSIRPWQHVLEPLRGYLMLARKLYERGLQYNGAWNFGPADEDAKSVRWIVETLCSKWNINHRNSYKIDEGRRWHEANSLKLDCSKAKSGLGWHPKWNLETAIDKLIEWTKAYHGNCDVRELCLLQIEDYTKSCGAVDTKSHYESSQSQ